MKKLGTLVSAIVIAALIVAIPATALAAGKTHEVKDMIVVSVDAKASTMTIKDEKGESHTYPLIGKAVSEAAKVTPNEKVNLTCQDNEKGEHTGIVGIKKAS